MPASELFDSEGVITSPMTVIEDGVLKTFLYNLESAAIAKIPSTAHAARSYSGKVGTSFSNLIVPCGEHSLESLFKMHPKCFYAVKLEGGSGCSAVSGEISIGAQGFWVENGKIVQPVDGVTLSANFFDLLSKIQAVGNSYNDLFSSYRIPDLMIEEMFISG